MLLGGRVFAGKRVIGLDGPARVVVCSVRAESRSVVSTTAEVVGVLNSVELNGAGDSLFAAVTGAASVVGGRRLFPVVVVVVC